MIKIKYAKTSDIQPIHAVQCRAFKAGFHEPLSLFEEMLGHYPEGCFAIWDDQTIAGYIFMHPSDDDRTDYEAAGWSQRGDEECLFIHDLCIDPEYQGKGLSRLAVDHIERFARAKNFKKIIGVAIEGVEKFWEKQGFTMIRSYLYNGENATFMEKVLP